MFDACRIDAGLTRLGEISAIVGAWNTGCILKSYAPYRFVARHRGIMSSLRPGERSLDLTEPDSRGDTDKGGYRCGP